MAISEQDHYTALVQSSDDAIISKDLNSIVQTWNPAAERLFGFTAAEMVGSSIRRLIPPERQAEEDEILEKITRGERFGQLISERLHKDGSLVPIFLTVSPVLDERGTVVGASKMARDAREFLAAQQKIEESELRLRLLADNMSQFAWIGKPDGTIIWYNRRWFEYTGTAPEEMQGQGWHACHHPDHAERVEAGFRRSLETGEEWEDIFPLRGADGEYRWFLSRALPIRDANGKITQWFGTNTDITEQREQTEQVQLLLREVNHRSKNLIATVQAIARRTADDPAFIDRFEQRLAGLSTNQDLLIRGQWNEVGIEELVREQLGFLGDSHGQLAITGPALALTAAAAEAIGMALHELATNSLKYGSLSTPGGRVAVDWEAGPGESGLTMWWRESGGPRVTPPRRKGFGTTLICDVPRLKLGAQVEIDYRPEGIVWSIETAQALARPAVAPTLA